MPEGHDRDEASEKGGFTLVHTPEHGGLLVPQSSITTDRDPSDETSGQGVRATGEAEPSLQDHEQIQDPAKVLRIAEMVKELLDEVRAANLDEASRIRLKEIYDESRQQLKELVSPDLAEELERMAIPFDTAAPSQAELRVAQAQLVGWLEGLFHGIQAALFTQQIAAQAKLGRQPGLARSDGERGPYL